MATYSFDKTTKIIQVASPATAVQVQELIDTIRSYEDELSAGISIPKIANAAGKDDLGGGAAVGITLTLLDGWTIQFAPRGGPGWETCIIQDGNLVGISGGGSYNPIEQADFVSIIQLGAVGTTIATVEGGSGGGGLTSAQTSAVVNLSLSAYETTGVASKFDVTGASVSSGDILSALSAYEIDGVASFRDISASSAAGGLTSAQTSAMVLCGLSAYESTGVVSKTDLDNITGVSATLPQGQLDYIASSVSGSVVSGIGAWGDLRWSKIYGIPLQQWDVIVLEDDEED